MQEELERVEEEDDPNALDQLKYALQGMVNNPTSKAPHNPNKYQMTTQNHVPVSDTPLNTE